METVNKKILNRTHRIQGDYLESLRYATSAEWTGGEPDLRTVASWKKEIVARCSPFTSTRQRAMLKLVDCVEHIVKNDIPGDFVETGVFIGGSCMIVACVLHHFKVYNRTIWMYDTFSGVPMPNDIERSGDKENYSIKEWWQKNMQVDGNVSNWCHSSKDIVEHNMQKVAWRVPFVMHEGLVEDTIPANIPEQIALLRIDVDLEYPTRHVLDHCYPKLSVGGHLILDDYGAFPSVQHTVNDYLYTVNDTKMYLDWVDFTVRHGVKV